MQTNTTAFNGKTLDVDVDAYLSQHDVVYLTPAPHGWDGFPLGNGDLGVMAWTPPERLHFQINKCDAWDDAPAGPFSAWEERRKPAKAECYSSLRSVGEVRIEPGLPVFDWMYLEEFEGRLSLADAKASWVAKGPLGQVACHAFVAADPPVIVIRYEDRLSEPVVRKVQLMRWGSRVFEHWYRFLHRGMHLGPPGTQAGGEKDELWIEQPTRSLKFAIAGKLVGPAADAVVRHRRAAGFELDAGDSCAFTLFLTAVTSEQADDPLHVARDIVRQAARAGEGAIFKSHKKYWTDFWSRSFIDLSDDYLTNLWYLNVYQVTSASRGRYPPHFISSLWAWNRDVRPWNHFYHWNQQIYTWPLHASGHPELMIPYAKWRREGLPQAIADAQRVHQCRGAFYTDVADRRGDQDTEDNRGKNLTPGAQIALDLWRHYEYTLDDAFLAEYAYPVMREAVRFYLDYLKKEDDGRYHVPEADAYETTFMRCKDTTSDLACIRKLFPAFAEASEKLGNDDDLRETAAHVLAHLADYVRGEFPDGVDNPGNVPPGTPIMACGTYLHTGTPGHFWMRGPEGQRTGSHIYNAQLAPIFPNNLIGLDQKGSPDYALLENTLRALCPIGAHGHNIVPICLARLGMGEELPAALKDWVDHYQLFSQGLFCYFRRDYRDLYEKGEYTNSSSASDHRCIEFTNTVEIVGSSPQEEIDLPKAPFAHMALEPGAILETTINEMLLQSHSGAIRVFPAVPHHWTARFKLHAVGGFIVTSERQAGEVLYVAVESKFGQPCHVVNPWPRSQTVQIKDLSDKDKVIFSGRTEQFEFDTTAGGVYLIERVGKPLARFRHERITGRKNQTPKRLGRAILGKPRQF